MKILFLMLMEKMLNVDAQNRRRTTLSVGICLIALVCTGNGNPDRKPPNIVLMIADDLGIGDIGCFGNSTIRTPNIDGLARDGAILTHHLAAASTCTPSRAALLTGRYPIRSGLVSHNNARVIPFLSSQQGLPPNETTFGEIAQDQGYATAYFGKWHLGLNCETYGDFCHHPLKQGFDRYYGLPFSNGPHLSEDSENILVRLFPWLRYIHVAILFCGVLLTLSLRWLGLGHTIIQYLILVITAMLAIFVYMFIWGGKYYNGAIMRDLEVVEMPARLPGFTDRLVSESVGYLRERRDGGKPFLMTIGWIQTHTALHAISPFSGRSAHGRYGDEVEELDWSVGEVLYALEELGMADNTFVYFTSDHGGHIEEFYNGETQGGWNGIYKGGKGQGGMEGGVRVPTVARWPGVIPPGLEIDVPTSLMDVLPTVAAIVGTDPPRDRTIDGANLLPLLRGEKTEAPPHEFLVHYCADQLHAARLVVGDGSDVYKAHLATPNWKPGVEYCDGFVCGCQDTDVTWHNPPIMYNIGRDPSETLPLDLSDQKHAAILDEILRRVEEHKAEIEQVPSQFARSKMLPRPWLQPCCGPWCMCQEPNMPPPRNTNNIKL